MFNQRSRYANIADAIYRRADGTLVKYKVLRITPDSRSIQNHLVAQGDRLDLIAFQHYGDPEQFWRICDGNDALRSDDLTDEIGARIRIPIVQR
jgi:hypothetical protein